MIETVMKNWKKPFILAFKALGFVWADLETPKQSEVRFLVTRVPAACQNIVKHWDQCSQSSLGQLWAEHGAAPGTLPRQEGVPHIPAAASAPRGSGSCCLGEQFQGLPQARRKRTCAPYQSFFCLARLSGHTEVYDWSQVHGSSEGNLLSRGWDTVS